MGQVLPCRRPLNPLTAIGSSAIERMTVSAPAAARRLASSSPAWLAPANPMAAIPGARAGPVPQTEYSVAMQPEATGSEKEEARSVLTFCCLRGAEDIVPEHRREPAHLERERETFGSR